MRCPTRHRTGSSCLSSEARCVVVSQACNYPRRRLTRGLLTCHLVEGPVRGVVDNSAWPSRMVCKSISGQGFCRTDVRPCSCGQMNHSLWISRHSGSLRSPNVTRVIVLTGVLESSLGTPTLVRIPEGQMALQGPRDTRCHQGRGSPVASGGPDAARGPRLPAGRR